MEDRSSRTGVTPLMVFYGMVAAAGAVVPWYFNIRHMRESGEMLTPQSWVAGGFMNPLVGSITSDFLIGTIPVLVLMVVEARRLGMRHWWFYVVTTFLVAFAFSCPLFLLMRRPGSGVEVPFDDSLEWLAHVGSRW
jgi:hypothetical protein